MAKVSKYSMSKKNKPALGKGLDSLLGGTVAELHVKVQEGSISVLPLDSLLVNKEQPRQYFSEEGLMELAESIKHLGIIQPLTVRHDEVTGKYLIISGERRYRAAQKVGLTTIPAYIRNATGGELLELALVENIQREDLNPIEVALSYQRLLEQTGGTQEALAKRIGKKRATISNYIRLLQLPAIVQLGLSEQRLDMGHARALLQVQDSERQLELYQMILEQSLSVREVEELARAINSTGKEDTFQEQKISTNLGNGNHKPLEEYCALEKHLAKVFATKVSLRYSKQGKGKISILFGSEEELERIMLLLERVQQE